jgi:aromatic-L-amino-acid decarboxylase
MGERGSSGSHYGAPDFDLRKEGAAALEWVAQYLDGLPELPVMAQVEPGDVRAALPDAPPEDPEPFDAVLRDLDEIIVPALTNWQHPRFFSYFAVTSAEPAMVAELIAAALNQVGFIWRSSPAATELELHTVDWVAQLLGLPEGWHGHIEDTASTSTLAALIAAREATGRSAILYSEHSHSSVEKAARMLALEGRAIATDGAYRMRPDLVERELARGDVAAVVATVGTTSMTSVDPVEELASLCARAGSWLHVDAAYAGVAWICPEHRWSQAGVAEADSLVVNPHKWMFVPADCSIVWTRRPDAFRRAFSLVPEYLRTDDTADSLSDYGPALGRRFRALKLWVTLRCFGSKAMQDQIRHAIGLAEAFESWVDGDAGWALAAPRHFSLVCFTLEGSDDTNLALLERVNASGEMFITHTRIDGRIVLRLAIGNARTRREDVERAWEVLRREAAQLMQA